jgi:hypothetical protein
MESCPFCGGQLISCRCVCDPNATRSWDDLEAKGRVPYIQYPNLCAKCGVLWPEMFSVPDEDWERYVEPRMRERMLCEACYRQIKTLIDDAVSRRREVK